MSTKWSPSSREWYEGSMHRRGFMCEKKKKRKRYIDEPDHLHAVVAVTDHPDTVAGEGLLVTDTYLTKG
jgi:hypothetical protein